MLRVVRDAYIVQNGVVVGKVAPCDLPVKRSRVCAACGDVVALDRWGEHTAVCGTLGWGSLRKQYGRLDLAPPKQARRSSIEGEIQELTALINKLRRKGG